jgi:hypothetical protein
MILRTTTPFTRFNNHLALSADQTSMLIKHTDQFIGHSFVDPAISGGANDSATQFNAQFLHQSFVYIITETVGDYPYPYFSEKTWKALVTGCPFMMVNARNSLAKLREFGFKTFSEWWSEEYDNKVTVADRIEGMINVLTEFSTLPISELQLLRNQMDSVIKHNHQHVNVFTAQDLKNITNMI